MDLTNPSSALGRQHQERSALLERGPADLVFALAIIHRLAISNNVPLGRLAEFLHSPGKWLMLEFLPKEDFQVQLLLASREDNFNEYSLEGMLAAFEHYFRLHQRIQLKATFRKIYLMERIEPR